MPDEPPIRVRNGSMRIELVGGEWKDDAQAWTPRGGTNRGGFVVLVERATRTGSTIERPVFGTQVEVSYTDDNHDIKVVKFKYHGASKKTRVTPKGILVNPAPRLLECGSPGQGYIASVKVKRGQVHWTYSFQNADSLVEVVIYPTPN